MWLAEPESGSYRLPATFASNPCPRGRHTRGITICCPNDAAESGRQSRGGTASDERISDDVARKTEQGDAPFRKLLGKRCGTQQIGCAWKSPQSARAAQLQPRLVRHGRWTGTL